MLNEERRDVMPVLYTNRKGLTFTLTQTVTKNGKTRYNFAREPVQGQPVEAVPEEWEIRESVNGIVTLGKTMPQLILPEELAAVAAQLRQLPDARRYRTEAKSDHILIYENAGGDLTAVVSGVFGQGFLSDPGQLERVRDLEDQHARFEPVMQFILVDQERRRFSALRMSYRGYTNHWINIGRNGPLYELAEKYVPALK
jgi:hypothetical protein